MKKILGALAIIFLIYSVNGQESELKFDDVQVIKDFTAEIGNFNKVNVDPVLPVYDIKSRIYEYKVRSIPAKMEYDKPKIRPLALKPENPKEFNRYYVKLGYGLPQLLNIDASAYFQRKSLSGDAGIRHISANNENSTKDQNISVSQLDIDLKNINKINNQILEFKSNINNSYIYLYGYKPGDSIIAADTKRRYLSAEISGSFTANELTDKIGNKTEIGFKTLQFNAKDVSENNLIIKNTTSYKLNENSFVELPAEVDYVLGSKSYIFNLKPYFIYSSRPLNLKAGFQAGISQDKKLLAPYIEISSNLFHNFIEIFAAYNSDFYNNTDFLKTSINPFLSFSEDEVTTSKFSNITVGLRNSLEGARLEVKATYMKFENHLFFKSADNRTFKGVYDDGTNVKIEAMASYKPVKKFEIGGSVIKNIYKLDNFDKPWYTPDLSANIFSKAQLLSDRIIVGGELYFGSAPWYEDTSGNNKKLDPLFDLNGSIKFMITKKSGFFINVNNIFAQKYQRWYDYPNYGLNFLVGLEIRF
ncbi:MAG: hypothetical protein IPH57_17300 [Saprospiraceae bacterium]|nr:hypothetical protein [Saprospiraceae bacterium]